MKFLQNLLVVALFALAAPVVQAQDSRIDVFREFTEAERNRLFAEQVEAHPDGFSCPVVTHSFIRGAVENEIFVTVKCSNGDDYGMLVEAEIVRILPCELLEVVTNVDCWMPL